MYEQNPYIVGTPINEPNRFFGRESLLNFIEDNLRQNVRFILLHGHRRIGKSSVLKQIPHQTNVNQFVFVHFDLQHHGDSRLSEILSNLAEEIVSQIELDSNQINIPTPQNIETDIDTFSHKFLLQIYKQLGEKNLVLLLDEFDVVCDDSTNILRQGLGFFPYLETLLKHHNKLFTIAVAGRHPSDLANLLRLFKSAPYQEIGFLDEPSAKRLICKPTQGILEYTQDAITAILQLTAGHPYFIQVICFNIFFQAKNNKNCKITQADVENVIDRAIRQIEGGLSWFWDGLTIFEKVVLSAVVEAQRSNNYKFSPHPENPLKLLENYGVIPTEELGQATTKLAKKGFLDHTERRIKIEFVRRWLVTSHPLSQEIRELERIHEEEINSLHDIANRLHRNNKKQQAINIYAQALLLNPNHFSTLLAQAELNLELANFDEALQLYERIYKINPVSNKEALVNALEMYASELTIKRKYVQAKEQYKKVLEIQPDRVSAQRRLEEIKGYEARRNYQKLINNNDQDKPKIRNVNTIAAIGGVIAIVALGIVVIDKWLNSCTTGQVKVDNVCVTLRANNIRSQGESTLFPTVRNTFRDQGLAAFQQGKYSQAVNFFAQAVQFDSKDPEVLIYYNNALAHQQSEPLTLAVVVPITNLKDIALEMLRAVALAQNQFNANGGFNGRLLQIVIANDANNNEQAKKVAQELINNQSILGVIGHYTSEATGEALYEYQKADPPLAIISPTSTSTALQNDFFFRATPSNKIEALSLAEYMKKKLKLKRVVIFYNRDKSYSNNLREEFTRWFDKLDGGQVVDIIDLAQTNLDADQKLKDSVTKYKAQAVLLFPEQPSVDIALNIAKAKDNSEDPKVRSLQLLGSASLYNEKTQNAPEGLIITVPWFREARESKIFAQNAKQTWGGEVSWRTATTYNATQAFIQSFSNNSSRQNVLQRLQQVNLPPQQTSGITVKFVNREIDMQPTLIQVKNGKFQELPK